MKWPASFTVIRHGQSEYNILKALKMADKEYLAFKAAYEKDHRSEETKHWAIIMRQKYRLITSDFETSLTDVGHRQAIFTGKRLSKKIPRPDVILYSPYKRTDQTMGDLIDGWQMSGDSISNVPCIADDRLREQEHGLALLYSDWRIFHAFHPEQKELQDLLGPYWYQYPQGESISQVRDRCRDCQSMLIREYAGMNVLAITHHLTKLSFRANLERLTPAAFVHLDDFEKPVNCGVTCYIGKSDLGKDGQLKFEFYNEKLYTDKEVK